MAKFDTVDQTLHWAMHYVGLMPIPLAIFFGSWWTCILAGLASGLWFSFWREDAQHRKEDGWAWPVKGNGGRWIDIAFGTLGGIFAGGTAAAIVKFVM